jgi:hypothetical protein
LHPDLPTFASGYLSLLQIKGLSSFWREKENTIFAHHCGNGESSK